MPTPAASRSVREKRRQREAELRRADIIAAASVVFGEKGFQGAQVTEIAGAAELSLNSVYTLFKGKEELYEAVLYAAAAKIRDEVQAKAETLADPAAQLLSTVNQLRAEGADARSAMLKAGPMRLRPVLMTAFSTIFGMIPVALANSDAAEFRNPMGVLVIGGLSSSTLLTLLVVPVAYTLLADSQVTTTRLLSQARSLCQRMLGRADTDRPPETGKQVPVKGRDL